MSPTPEQVALMFSSPRLGERLQALNLLRQLSPLQALPIALKAATDPNARVRYGAICQIAVLGRQDLSATLALLRHTLHQDPEADVQAAAADALSALKLTEAFEDIQQKYTQTQDWLVKFSIVAALGELGDARGFDLLVDALTTGDDLVQTAAIGSLGELGDRRAVPFLLPYTSHPDWQIRCRLARALGQLGGPEVVNSLQSLAADPVSQVAQEAAAVLAVL